MKVCPVCGAAGGACTPAGGAAPLAKPIAGSTTEQAAYAGLLEPEAADPPESDPVDEPEGS